MKDNIQILIERIQLECERMEQELQEFQHRDMHKLVEVLSYKLSTAKRILEALQMVEQGIDHDKIPFSL